MKTKIFVTTLIIAFNSINFTKLNNNKFTGKTYFLNDDDAANFLLQKIRVKKYIFTEIMNLFFVSIGKGAIGGL